MRSKGLYKTGNTTNLHFPSGGAELDVDMGWSAFDVPGGAGEGSITPAAATGRITLTPGYYLVTLELSVENNTTSGLSSEDVTVQDTVAAYIARGGTEVTGGRTKFTALEGLTLPLSVTVPVEITDSHVDASTNYVSAFLDSILGTTSDLLIVEARLLVHRLD
jgi:hypothetical protein